MSVPIDWQIAGDSVAQPHVMAVCEDNGDPQNEPYYRMVEPQFNTVEVLQLKGKLFA